MACTNSTDERPFAAFSSLLLSPFSSLIGCPGPAAGTSGLFTILIASLACSNSACSFFFSRSTRTNSVSRRDCPARLCCQKPSNFLACCNWVIAFCSAASACALSWLARCSSSRAWATSDSACVFCWVSRSKAVLFCSLSCSTSCRLSRSWASSASAACWDSLACLRSPCVLARSALDEMYAWLALCHLSFSSVLCSCSSAFFLRQCLSSVLNRLASPSNFSIILLDCSSSPPESCSWADNDALICLRDSIFLWRESFSRPASFFKSVFWVVNSLIWSFKPKFSRILMDASCCQVSLFWTITLFNSAISPRSLKISELSWEGSKTFSPLCLVVDSEDCDSPWLIFCSNWRFSACSVSIVPLKEIFSLACASNWVIVSSNLCFSLPRSAAWSSSAFLSDCKRLISSSSWATLSLTAWSSLSLSAAWSSSAFFSFCRRSISSSSFVGYTFSFSTFLVSCPLSVVKWSRSSFIFFNSSSVSDICSNRSFACSSNCFLSCWHW